MASLEKHEQEEGPTRWVVRWRDPAGRQHKKSFTKKGDADRFLTNTAADLLRGDYLDPRAGKETLQSYADRWLTAQTFDPSTREAVELRLRLHVYPTVGSSELRAIKPSSVQAWMRGLEGRLAPATTRVIFANLSTVLSAAVDDDLIRRNPCKAASVRAPRRPTKRVTPWPADTVLALRDALPDRYKVVVALGAGLGLRQGEVFGLSPGDVDFLRGFVTIQRQVKLIGSRLVFALPKGQKVRTVPLPGSVRDDLAAHLTRFPAAIVTLPWSEPTGKPTSVPLVLTSRESKAVARTHFNNYVWKRAARLVGLDAGRDEGCHALRHYYASVLLDGGESIKALSEYLGHSDPGFTLRVYTHLMPSSEERTRRAIDAVLGPSRALTVPEQVRGEA